MPNSEIQIRPIETLRPHPKNARTHPKKQVRQIANSIVRFGWTARIVTDGSGVILAGVGRYLAALLLGLKEVPVIVVSGLSEAEIRCSQAGATAASFSTFDIRHLYSFYKLIELRLIAPNSAAPIFDTSTYLQSLSMFSGDMSAVMVPPIP